MCISIIIVQAHRALIQSSYHVALLYINCLWINILPHCLCMMHYSYVCNFSLDMMFVVGYVTCCVVTRSVLICVRDLA